MIEADIIQFLTSSELQVSHSPNDLPKTSRPHTSAPAEQLLVRARLKISTSRQSDGLGFEPHVGSGRRIVVDVVAPGTDVLVVCIGISKVLHTGIPSQSPGGGLIKRHSKSGCSFARSVGRTSPSGVVREAPRD
jgi:hypothetical protein